MAEIAHAGRHDPYVNQRYQAASVSSGALYLRAEDNVRLSTFSTTAALEVSLNGVIVGLDGEVKPLNMHVVTDATGARKAVSNRIGEGFLLYAAVSVSGGTPAPGDVVVSVELTQGQSSTPPVIAVLTVDSPTANFAIPVWGGK